MGDRGTTRGRRVSVPASKRTAGTAQKAQRGARTNNNIRNTEAQRKANNQRNLYTKKAPRKKAKNPPAWLLGICGALVVGVICMILVVALDDKQTKAMDPENSASLGETIFYSIFPDPATHIVKGVAINGIDVSGMTIEEARVLVEPPLKQEIDKIRLILKYQDRTWEMSSTDLGYTTDIESVLEQALKLAKTEEGKIDSTVAHQLKNQPVNLETKISYDETKLREELSAIASELGTPAVNATITFNPNAKDKADMFSVTEGKPGISMDPEPIVQQFNETFAVGGTMQIDIVVQNGAPQYSADFLKQCTKPLVYIKEDGKFLNTAFYTVVNGTKERKANVELAMSAFNGLVVWPGEVVSFNKTTGERSKANGYQEAPGIAGDKSMQPTLGGGVCQASTTIYNAALIAGCEVIERNNHSIASGYVRKGFDAMVNWPDTDLRFKNVSDGPIFFRTWYKNDRAYVMIYGKPLEDGIVYERISDIFEEVPPPDEVEFRIDQNGDYVTYSDEEYVYRRANEGIKVHSVLARVELSTGKELDRKILFTDYYRAYGAIIYVGAKERPETPQPSSTGSENE